jgi:hypothetical protein
MPAARTIELKAGDKVYVPPPWFVIMMLADTTSPQQHSQLGPVGIFPLVKPERPVPLPACPISHYAPGTATVATHSNWELHG